MTVKFAQSRASLSNFEFHDLLSRQETFREAFLRTMGAPEKSIPCRFLYDARGSALFDEICDLPDYYPTRTEISILKARADDLAALIGPGAVLIELGSGSSVKTRILLDRMIKPAAYMPIDVSREHLRAAAEEIAADYPDLQVEAVCADYSEAFDLPAAQGRRVGFFPGSTIGNLSREEARMLLSLWREKLGPGGLMIIGADLKKESRALEAAYNDPEGVTEGFIKNILARANRELGGDFDITRFDYEARYYAAAGRVEMHLVSKDAQTVTVAGRNFTFHAGEHIHIENSHKYGLEEFAELARSAGFTPDARFTDPARLFSVHLLAA